MTEVIPGILEQDFSGITRKIRLVENYVSWVQIDLLDGTLFGNTNFHDPSPFSSLRTPLNLELHMMVKNPIQMVDQWAEVGIKRFIAHTEGLTNIDQFIDKVKEKKLEAGLAIDIETEVSVLFPYLDKIDVVLIMGIHTGKSGQSFQELAVGKVKEVREKAPNLPIEVDGGVGGQTAERLVKAGATRLVTTSYIFSAPNLYQAIQNLQRL